MNPLFSVLTSFSILNEVLHSQLEMTRTDDFDTILELCTLVKRWTTFHCCHVLLSRSYRLSMKSVALDSLVAFREQVLLFADISYFFQLLGLCKTAHASRKIRTSQRNEFVILSTSSCLFTIPGSCQQNVLNECNGDRLSVTGNYIRNSVSVVTVYYC